MRKASAFAALLFCAGVLVGSLGVPSFRADATYLPSLQLLQEKSFSAQSSVTFTGFNTTRYDEYRIQMLNIQTNGVLTMLVSTNGGSTYDTTANYQYGGFGQWIEGIVDFGSNGNSYAAVAYGLPLFADFTDSATFGGNGEVELKSPGTVNGVNSDTYYFSHATKNGGNLGPAGFWTQGRYSGANGSKVNAIKIQGNLVSPGTYGSETVTGMLRIYGIPK